MGRNKLQKLWIIPAIWGIYFINTLLNTTCVIKSMVGFPCMGCGMTRAWLSVLSLDLATAFAYHPMFWSTPILFLYYWFDGKLFKNKIVNRIIAILIALGFLGTGIYRMIV